MANYKTPGVYVEEISTLGSSIAGVPTAITGFVGYTEKATFLDGTSAANQPVRITSLLEFQQIFGGAYKEKFEVTLTGSVPTPTAINIIPKSNSNALSNFILFYQVQMFYANGGGTCYIVSVGNYASFPTTAAMTTALSDGIDKFEQIDEITLLCAPESVFLTTIGQRKTVYNKMAKQCAKLQDRFAILDTVHNGNTTVTGNNTIFQDATDFRNNDISADNLKYAAAYYPALNTPIGYFYNDVDVTIKDNRPIAGTGPYSTSPNNTLSTINSTPSGALVQASTTFNITGTGPFAVGSPPDNIEILITGVITQLFSPTGTAGIGTYVPGASLATSLIALANSINTDPVISQFVVASFTTTSLTLTAKQFGAIGNYNVKVYSNRFASGTLPVSQPLSGGGTVIAPDLALYNIITTELSKYTLQLYPSAAMAGAYAQVDASRGVWKAPANIGLALVNQPAITITDDDQENLNVDSVSGKSINAIREFMGRGTLVWGARTLAGNDNEWRYINVRRLFIYVEESAKKATEFVVFEANTANTWQRVKGMIDAFLTSLWRDGALAGATPKDAFFVRVGLGTTMTAQDILEGRMVVEIGLAAARPAEFIILRFSHKLQES